MSLPMPPDAILPLTGIRTNPLPQTWDELGKQLKDGAKGLKEDFKQGVADHVNGMASEAMRRIENTDYNPLLSPFLWKKVLNRGIPPLMISEDAMEELRKIPETENVPKSI